MAPILFGFLLLFILIIYFGLKLLKGKFNDLINLLLGIKSIDEGAFLRNFKELYEEMLLVDTAVTDTEFHEQVLELSFGRVV